MAIIQLTLKSTDTGLHQLPLINKSFCKPEKFKIVSIFNKKKSECAGTSRGFHMGKLVCISSTNSIADI